MAPRVMITLRNLLACAPFTSQTSPQFWMEGVELRGPNPSQQSDDNGSFCPNRLTSERLILPLIILDIHRWTWPQSEWTLIKTQTDCWWFQILLRTEVKFQSLHSSRWKTRSVLLGNFEMRKCITWFGNLMAAGVHLRGLKLCFTCDGQCA